MNHVLFALFLVNGGEVLFGIALHDPTLVIMNGVGMTWALGWLIARAPS